MVTKVMKRTPGNGDVAGFLHNLGLVVAGGSLVLGLLTWFLVPAGFYFVSGVEIIFLFAFFLLGVVSAIVGRVMMHKGKTPGA